MLPGKLPRKLGLIVGLNDYQDSAFQALRFAENDAKALAQWFVNAKGGKWSPPDLQLVRGQHATKELVESLLTQLYLQVAETGDEIVFYFAGHAFVDERSGDGYLALANTRYQDTGTAVNVRTLMRSIQSQSRAGHILCIFDCFQKGPVWDMRRTSQYDSKPLLGTATLAALQQSSNRLCMFSCRGNASAGETGENALGAFTHRLLLGLCGPAAEAATGNVTLAKLHAYLFNKLSEQHRPQLFGQQTTPFILVGDPVPTTISDAQLSSSPVQESPRVGQEYVKTPERSRSGLLKLYGSASSSASVSTASQVASVPADSGQAPSPNESLPTAVLDEQEQYKQILEQAQQYKQNQNYKEAFDLVEQVLQMAPNDIAALTLKGQLLGTAGRFTEAMAVVAQILQHDPNNALAWNMRAVLLSNMGQLQEALSAIERSLEMDANNPESYSIKTHIMEMLASQQAQSGKRPAALVSAASQRQVSPGTSSGPPTKDNPRAFFSGAGLQVLGFVLGAVGAASPYFLPQTVPYASLALACLGLAIMCVVATQGSFRYGFTRFIITMLFTILSAAILGVGYLGLARIVANIQAQTQVTPQAAVVRLLTFGFIGLWLAAAAILPWLGSIIGLVARAVVASLGRGRTSRGS